MKTQEVEIVNRLGLHARAAAKVVELAGVYACSIALVKDGRRVDAKSIMSVMMLAATMGSTVEIETDGVDEDEAMKAMVALVGERFGENE
ncbi:MAG: HPr family phosphocarrier protein [Pseudomonadota bacterium]